MCMLCGNLKDRTSCKWAEFALVTLHWNPPGAGAHCSCLCDPVMGPGSQNHRRSTMRSGSHRQVRLHVGMFHIGDDGVRNDENKRPTWSTLCDSFKSLQWKAKWKGQLDERRDRAMPTFSEDSLSHLVSVLPLCQVTQQWADEKVLDSLQQGLGSPNTVQALGPLTVALSYQRTALQHRNAGQVWRGQMVHWEVIIWLGSPTL